MNIGNGCDAMLGKYGSRRIHGLGFLVLVQICHRFRSAGSYFGGDELPKIDVRQLLPDTRFEVLIELCLLIDELLDDRAVEEPLTIICTGQNAGKRYRRGVFVFAVNKTYSLV